MYYFNKKDENKAFCGYDLTALTTSSFIFTFNSSIDLAIEYKGRLLTDTELKLLMAETYGDSDWTTSYEDGSKNAGGGLADLADGK